MVKTALTLALAAISGFNVLPPLLRLTHNGIHSHLLDKPTSVPVPYAQEQSTPSIDALTREASLETSTSTTPIDTISISVHSVGCDDESGLLVPLDDEETSDLVTHEARASLDVSLALKEYIAERIAKDMLLMTSQDASRLAGEDNPVDDEGKIASTSLKLSFDHFIETLHDENAMPEILLVFFSWASFLALRYLPGLMRKCKGRKAQTQTRKGQAISCPTPQRDADISFSSLESKAYDESSSPPTPSVPTPTSFSEPATASTPFGIGTGTYVPPHKRSAMATVRRRTLSSGGGGESPCVRKAVRFGFHTPEGFDTPTRPMHSSPSQHQPDFFLDETAQLARFFLTYRPLSTADAVENWRARVPLGPSHTVNDADPFFSRALSRHFRRTSLDTLAMADDLFDAPGKGVGVARGRSSSSIHLHASSESLRANADDPRHD